MLAVPYPRAGSCACCALCLHACRASAAGGGGAPVGKQAQACCSGARISRCRQGGMVRRGTRAASCAQQAACPALGPAGAGCSVEALGGRDPPPRLTPRGCRLVASLPQRAARDGSHLAPWLPHTIPASWLASWRAGIRPALASPRWLGLSLVCTKC